MHRCEDLVARFGGAEYRLGKGREEERRKKRGLKCEEGEVGERVR